MFTRRFALLALVTTAIVSGALIFLLDAAPVAALFTGLAAGVLAGVMPAASRDGRFPGAHGGRRRATVVANVVILGSALVVPAALGLDRTTQLSLSLLVLLTGYAAFMLGSAAVIEEIQT